MDAIRTAVTDVGTYSIPNTVMEFVTQMLGLTPVLEEAQHANDEVSRDVLEPPLHSWFFRLYGVNIKLPRRRK